MATTRFIDHLLEGDHASRPAAGDVPEGTLYSCTTHSLVYQSDTATWSTWATLGGSSSLDAILAASSGEDIADALTGAAAPDAGNVFATMADVGGGGIPADAFLYLEQAADPDADDDEFDTPDTDPLTGWTTLGTVTTLDADTTVPDHLYLVVPADAGTRVDGIYKSHTLAAGEAFVARLDADDTRATFNRAGIFIAVASPGRIDTMGVLWNSARQFEVLAMTNPTTFSSTVGSGNLANQYIWPLYLAIRCNSSTSYDYLYGYGTPTGNRWFRIVTARNPSMTQATCGIFANAQNGSTAIKSIFKWARFYATLGGVEST